MARVVAVGNFAQDHQVHLVVAVCVDLNGAMVTPGDVRPDCFTQIADLYKRIVLTMRPLVALHLYWLGVWGELQG